MLDWRGVYQIVSRCSSGVLAVPLPASLAGD